MEKEHYFNKMTIFAMSITGKPPKRGACGRMADNSAGRSPRVMTDILKRY